MVRKRLYCLVDLTFKHIILCDHHLNHFHQVLNSFFNIFQTLCVILQWFDYLHQSSWFQSVILNNCYFYCLASVFKLMFFHNNSFRFFHQDPNQSCQLVATTWRKSCQLCALRRILNRPNFPKSAIFAFGIQTQESNSFFPIITGLLFCINGSKDSIFGKLVDLNGVFFAPCFRNLKQKEQKYSKNQENAGFG